MNRARLDRLSLGPRARRLAKALLVAVSFLAASRANAASALSSQVLIDPVGEFTGDVFGCSVAWIGDVNGDGYDDFLIGAFRFPEIASYGKAYLYFGGPALDATPDLTLVGETTGALTAFGQSVASAGDLNDDGFGDVIVGAPLYGNRPGRAYVFFGGATPDAVPDRVFNGLVFNDQLGTVVGSAGDMNGDGHPDVFASAPANSAGALGAGAIYVWFGGPGFDTTSDLTLLGSTVNEGLMYAANAGDINADGFSDLVGAGRSQVRVWFGGATPNAVPDLTLGRTFATVAGAGDVNGDDVDDFVVGAPYASNGAGLAGRVSLYYGANSPDTLEDHYYVPDQPGGNLGLRVAGGGRVDGPGPPDLIASATYDPEAIGYNQGRVYVFGNSFEPTAVPPQSPAAGLRFVGPTPNPASNEVNLAMELDRTVRVRVTVFDLTGHEVARPIDDEWLAGRVTRSWRPAGLPSGVYYVRANLGGTSQVRKLVWLGEAR